MIKKMFNSQRGVALMLVLAAITVLTVMSVEFAYNTTVNYHLATGERDRLKAYYLAKSAYNFMLLEMKFDRVFRRIVAQQNLGEYLGASAQLPLCQQFPLSTGLIRAVFTGDLAAALGGAGAEGGEGPGEEITEEAIEDMQRDVSISQEKTAGEFLQFEGDFDGECVDEATKIDLNGFDGLQITPVAEGSVSPFDQYKQFLYRFLSRPQFDLLFEKADINISDIINNIGDWIDTNADINELGGRSGGDEGSVYSRLDVGYRVRNGKLITLLEAYLIGGVADEWFAPLVDNFTIYGDGKINVCTTGEAVLESLINRYVDSTPGLPPLRLEDPDEMGRLTSAVREACASGAIGDSLNQQVTQALDSAIGALSGEEPFPQGQRQGQRAGFASYITATSRFFSLVLTGQVHDAMVRIKAVVDIGEPDPKKWKLLYWRVY